MKLYNLADLPTMEEANKYGFVAPSNTKYLKRCLKVRRTGEFRAPKAGEWFLSSAPPEGYRTKNDLDTAYYIVKLVVVNSREVWDIEEQ